MAVALTAPQSAPLPKQSVSPQRVIAFFAMVFGMFMSILDIQIVSASLNEIQAGISASADEVTWVQTAYLIAEVIMIPLSGFLSRAFSTRVLFTVCAGGFTLMSFLCAQANTIETLILFRCLQGFIGGGMIPTVFASAFAIFPIEKRAIVQPVIGLVATLAPTIGPTVGGYLTDLFSWRWLFLVNVAPGILVTLISWALIDFDRPNYKLLKNFDWAGLISMAIFLGALEYVLEEGPNKNWFEDPIILYASCASFVGALIFLWRSSVSSNPVVDLRIRNGSFWTGCPFSLALGVGLYGLTFIYPVFLGRVRGDTAMMIGTTLFLSGLVMFLSAPLVSRLMQILDPRVMMCIGLLDFAFGTFIASFITKDWDFWELALPQMCRGSGLMLCMVPINMLALGSLKPDQLKNGSGVFNLTRNLGGAIGLAIINTLLNTRMDLHLARLHEQVTWSSNAALERFSGLTARLTPVYGPEAQIASVKQVARLVRREALTMAIADIFFLMTLLFLFMALITPMIRKPSALSEGSEAH